MYVNMCGYVCVCMRGYVMSMYVWVCMCLCTCVCMCGYVCVCMCGYVLVLSQYLMMRYVLRYLGHDAIRIAILVYRVSQCLDLKFVYDGNAIYRPRYTLHNHHNKLQNVLAAGRCRVSETNFSVKLQPSPLCVTNIKCCTMVSFL